MHFPSRLVAVMLGLVIGLGYAESGYASATTPQRSLRGLVGRPLWLPICSRRGVNGSASWYDNSNTAIMDQVMCYSPSWGTVTAIKLVYAAFDMPNQGEVDRPVTATIANASVFCPSCQSVGFTTSAAFTTGSTSLACSPSAYGCNGVSAGQYIKSSYITGGTYVTSVVNAFQAGSGNTPVSTTINLSASPSSAGPSGTAMTAAGQIVPCRFGGRTGALIAPSHDVVTSDPTSIPLPPSTQFFVRTAATMSATGLQLADYPGTGTRYTGTGLPYQNEFDSRGTTLSDHTMDPTNQGNTGGGYWGPVAVLGLVTPSGSAPPQGAALILGDSIATGTGDVADTLYLQGYIQRSFENNFPFVTAARGSTTAQEEAVAGAGQFALTADTGITDVLLELGRNDIQQFGASAASLEGSIQAISSRYAAAGKHVWCFSIPPTTLSTDGWTTLANQSWVETAYSASASVPTGSTAITLAGSGCCSGVAVGQTMAVAAVNATIGTTAIAAGSTSLAMASATGLANGQSVYGAGIAAGTTITGVSGSTLTISKATTATIAANTTLNFGTAIAPGTTISAWNSSTSTATLSAATLAAIASGTTVNTGSATPNNAENYRLSYNAYLRNANNRTSLGCYGLIDVDSIMADPGGSGKWRVDLGAGSIDGVHPQEVVHQAVVNSSLISPNLFYTP